MRKMEEKIPNFLYESLIQQYGQELTGKIIDGYSHTRVTTLRVNNLKTNIDEVKNELDKEQIEKVLLGEGAVEDKVIKLIKKANNRGGTDNISVAYLVREEEGDDK